MNVPVGTYRVQLCPSFTFEDATAAVPYLAALGVSHLYASPHLQAASGSTHGYDVVDPGRVNDELGGDAGRQGLCRALQAAGMAQLIDIVPNHMAIRGGHNAWWWDVLENGPSSRYSSFFDVEWRASESERVLLPILADQYGVELEAGKISIVCESGKFFVRYYEHKNPIAPRALGYLLRPVAEQIKSSQLGFVADALADLPSPHAQYASSRRRRHRDKEVLLARVVELCAEPEVMAAVERHLAHCNATPDALDEIMERQIYRLAWWRVGNHELDYRRFFDIDSLVGLRVEDEEVFDAVHELPLSWLAEGSVAGVRIDHIDGLYDPRGYLERLHTRAPGAWILVEKILEQDERLRDWPVAGTTGYEFLNQAQGLLTWPAGEEDLTSLYHELLGHSEEYEAVVESCKHLVLKDTLASDVRRLTARLTAICHAHRRHRDYAHVDLETALVELCVAYPVYRTYASPDGTLADADRAIIAEACARARDAAPNVDPRLFEFFEQLLTLQIPGEEELEFVLRLQQLTGPAMAKGAEDTAFYRYNRLVALNEVGGNPGRFATDVREFHALMRERQAQSPLALNCTATHDTKRSEEVRARLLCLSEVPEVWARALGTWRARLAPHKSAGPVDTGPLPEPRTEYLLWQNLVGAWPIEQPRMAAYLVKATREAKLHSSWNRPNEEYEAAVLSYLGAIYADLEVCDGIADFVKSLEKATAANSLSQVLLKLLCPGVPDVFQGTELWDYSLVDPDNRRPVDYASRQSWIDTTDRATPSDLWRDRESGAIKLFLIRRALQLRARRGACFGAQGSYTPLEPEGARARRVVAFSRGADVVAVATRWWLRHDEDFGDTNLTLPEGRWANVLTSQSGFEGQVPVATLLGGLPVGALEREQRDG